MDDYLTTKRLMAFYRKPTTTTTTVYMPETMSMTKKLQLAIAKEKRKILLSFNRWRDCTLVSFGYDPLKCPCCGETMLFLDLYHNHQHVSLNEMYERAMSRFHAYTLA